MMSLMISISLFVSAVALDFSQFRSFAMENSKSRISVTSSFSMKKKKEEIIRKYRRAVLFKKLITSPFFLVFYTHFQHSPFLACSLLIFFAPQQVPFVSMLFLYIFSYIGIRIHRSNQRNLHTSLSGSRLSFRDCSKPGWKSFNTFSNCRLILAI